MILEDFVLHTKANQTFPTSGIDSAEQCRDKLHFQNYPHPVSYKYNSYGFRDSEWPKTINDLKKSIWCVGDSFTVGLGNCEEHVWTHMLEKRLGIRCINVSLDGASNQWIARKIKRIQEEINPAIIIAQWTYITRSESADTTLSDEQRRMHCDPRDFLHLEPQDYYSRFNDLLMSMDDSLINSAIPKFNVFDTPVIFRKDLYEVEKLDVSRDGFHYGQLSADKFVGYLCRRLETIKF